MSDIEPNPELRRRLVLEALLAHDFRRATFGGIARGPAPAWVRVVVRPVELAGLRHLQFAYFDQRKSITKNYHGDTIPAMVDEVLAAGFPGIHLSTAAEEIDLRTTKRGRMLVGRRPATQAAIEPELGHNRSKNVPLPEGRPDRLLQALGIQAPNGRIRPAMRAKYIQVNECLKLFSHVVEDAGLRSSGRPLTIVDCGCGLGYLTFAVHHYLNDILGIASGVWGVDVNEEVIRKSIDRSDQLGVKALGFTCGAIGAADAIPDVVLALHACDTATDDALALAVAAESRVLLCAPCCHHHLNDQIRVEGPATVLRPLLRHGILRERMADMVTDTFRALALRIMGYRTEVIEFVSTEHTARNVMIRAVRGGPTGAESHVNEYRALRRFWGVTPYLERVFGEGFRRLVANGPA
jgi:hypothetical protein